MLHHRSQQFEAEQTELQQKLAGLQKELTVLKQQYNSLLEQVGQQHSLIQQLSESQGTQSSEEKLSNMDSEETEICGERQLNLDLMFCYSNLNIEYIQYIYIELSALVSPAESADHANVEPSMEKELQDLPVKEQLSSKVSGLGELSNQSDEAFRYNHFLH